MQCRYLQKHCVGFAQMFERGKGNSRTELGRYQRSWSTCPAPQAFAGRISVPCLCEALELPTIHPFPFLTPQGWGERGEDLTTGAWDQHTTGCVSYRSTSQFLSMGAVLFPQAGVMLKHPTAPSPPLISWFPMETHFWGREGIHYGISFGPLWQPRWTVGSSLGCSAFAAQL